MQITFDIPDAQAPQVIDGICAATGWTVASGVAKGAWAKDAIVKYIKDTAKRGQARQAMINATTVIDPLNIT
jgi:hypothetical protein